MSRPIVACLCIFGLAVLGVGGRIWGAAAGVPANPPSRFSLRLDDLEKVDPALQFIGISVGVNTSLGVHHIFVDPSEARRVHIVMSLYGVKPIDFNRDAE